MNWKKWISSLSLIACLLFETMPTMAFAAEQQDVVKNQNSNSVPFTDVDMNSWYGDSVQYVYKHQLMSGTSKTTFEPNIVMSRAMVAQILYNQSDRPEITDGDSGFIDVVEKDWFYTAVKWARENGYAVGVGSNRFDPNAAVTREQFAQFLYNYIGQPDVQGDDLQKFPDGNSVSWSKNAMTWAVQNKLINGLEKADGIEIRPWLMPHDNATRAQAATILKSFYIKIITPENTVASGECGENVSWALDKSGVLYIRGMGDMAENHRLDSSPWNEIASKVKTVLIEEGVTSICDRAFFDFTNMTNITISNQVVSIGCCAFSNCQSLKSIEIPDSVTKIDEGAFSKCINLLNITMPRKITTISAEEFSGCESLKKFEIPNSVTTIGKSAFFSCSSLEKIEIPNSVTTIGKDAFSSCSSLENITIPDNITKLDGTFSGCEQLVDVKLPSNIINIGDGTFSLCRNLESIEIPNSVTNLGAAAFYECTNLKKIEIPDSVETIGSSAFAYDYNLSDIRLPMNLTDLEESVFYGCDNLTSIELSQNITRIGGKAFGHSGLTTVEIPASVTEIEKSAFIECLDLSHVRISSGVSELGEWMFYGCSNLTDIEIPDSVTRIGKTAFWDCNALSDVYYEGTEEQWKAIVIGESNQQLNSATIHYNS